MSNYDFVADSELPYYPAKICDTVEDLASASLCRIALTYKGKTKDVEVARSPQKISREEEKWRCVFDAETGIELRLLRASFGGRLDVRYRGAPVTTSLSYENLSLEANLHSGDAKELLQLSRNKFTSVGTRLAKAWLDAALVRALPQWLLHAKDEELQDLSLRACLYGPSHVAGDAWKQLVYPTDPRNENTTEKKLTFGELAECTSLYLHVAPSSYHEDSPPGSFSYMRTKNGISFKNLEHVTRWFARFVRLHFKKRTFLGYENEHKGRCYRFCKAAEEKEDVTDGGLRYALCGLGGYGIGSREMLPCPQGFSSLAIPQGAPGFWHRYDEFISRTMASPFVKKGDAIRVPHPVEYVRWLRRVRLEAHTGDHMVAHDAPEQNTTELASIAARLLDFLQHADKLMESEWEKKDYKLDVIAAQLEAEFGPIPGR